MHAFVQCHGISPQKNARIRPQRDSKPLSRARRLAFGLGSWMSKFSGSRFVQPCQSLIRLWSCGPAFRFALCKLFIYKLGLFSRGGVGVVPLCAIDGEPMGGHWDPIVSWSVSLMLERRRVKQQLANKNGHGTVTPRKWYEWEQGWELADLPWIWVDFGKLLNHDRHCSEHQWDLE